MALVKDDLGLEVDEEVLKTVQDPKFSATASILEYLDKRKNKIAENDLKKKQEDEDKKPKGLFGLDFLK